MRFENYEASGYGHELGFANPSRINCVFHILLEVGCKERSIQVRRTYLEVCRPIVGTSNL